MQKSLSTWQTLHVTDITNLTYRGHDRDDFAKTRHVDKNKKRLHVKHRTGYFKYLLLKGNIELSGRSDFVLLQISYFIEELNSVMIV